MKQVTLGRSEIDEIAVEEVDILGQLHIVDGPDLRDQLLPVEFVQVQHCEGEQPRRGGGQ